MKKIIIASLLVCCFTFGCKKGNDFTVSNQPPAETNAAVKPTASFKIANLTSSGYILEANITDFQNLSQNGNTYHWDFGNGIVSNEKVPQGIAFAPCGAVNTITLTVTGTSGETASYSQTYTILCRGKHAKHAAITKPVHLRTNEISGFMQNL